MNTSMTGNSVDGPRLVGTLSSTNPPTLFFRDFHFWILGTQLHHSPIAHAGIPPIDEGGWIWIVTLAPPAAVLRSAAGIGRSRRHKTFLARPQNLVTFSVSISIFQISLILPPLSRLSCTAYPHSLLCCISFPSPYLNLNNGSVGAPINHQLPKHPHHDLAL